VYGEHPITVEIQGGIVHGDVPRRALRHVLERLGLREHELPEEGKRIQAGRPANKLAPLRI